MRRRVQQRTGLVVGTVLAAVLVLAFAILPRGPLPVQTWTYDTPVTAVIFSPDGQVLAVGGGNGLIHFRQVRDGTMVRALQAPAGLTSLAFSPDGQLLAAGTRRLVRLWRPQDGREVRTLDTEGERVSSVAFSPDGLLIAAGTGVSIRVWNVSGGHLVHQLTGHEDEVTAIAFSPDGNILASGSGSPEAHDSAVRPARDISVRMWSVREGRLLRTLTEARHGTGSVAFSPKGQVLAGAGGLHDFDPAPMGRVDPDAAIRLWRVRDGNLVTTRQGHTNRIASIAWSPDGQLLASGGFDRTVRLWQVP